MQPIRDLAIVLRSVPFGERHRVVTALTEKNGQISALARNSIQSRRFGGTLEPFAASEWLMSLKPGAELYNLSEAVIRQPFEGLRKSFEILSLASVLNELMLKLSPQNESCEELFRLHSNALTALNEMAEGATSNPPHDLEIILLNAYLAKLLQWSGNQPRLKACLQCGIELQALHPNAELSCNIIDAGWVCPSCREKETHDDLTDLQDNLQDNSENRRYGSFQHLILRVKPLAVHDIHLSLYTPIRKVIALTQASTLDHRELFKFLEALYVYHIPGFDKNPIKSLRFLGLVSTAQPEAVMYR